MHVEDIKDICMECNTTYSRLNDMHVEDVKDDKNTHNVAFWTSNDWFMGGACGLDLISQNQRWRALSTWGRKDSRLRFWLSTLPASTISLILPLCFFHVDSVDWLILNLLQTSTAFKPQSNLPSISIFSFSVLSVCWCLGFDTDILNANRKKHWSFYIILNAFISHVEDVKDYIKDIWKKAFISHIKCRRWKENHHTIHKRRVRGFFS